MGGNHQTSIHLKLVVWSSRYKSTNFHPNFRALEIGGSRKEGKFPWTFTWIWAGNNMQTTVFFSFVWWMPVGKNNFWLKIVCFGKHHFKSVTLNGWYFKHSPLGGGIQRHGGFSMFWDLGSDVIPSISQCEVRDIQREPDSGKFKETIFRCSRFSTENFSLKNLWCFFPT